jgi:hypothetical protein
MPAAVSVTVTIMSSLSFRCGLSPGDLSHRSGPPEKRDAASQGNIAREADGYLVAINYDRDLHASSGVSEHLSQRLRIFINIDIDGPLSVGRTSLVAIGSGIRAVNDDFVCHVKFLFVPMD